MRNKKRLFSTIISLILTIVMISPNYVFAAESRDINVKFMIDGRTVIAEKKFPVESGKNTVITAEELKKILPEGYALIGNESIRVTDQTSEVRVLVKSLTRKVPVKFMMDGRTVVSESELKVEIGKNTVITAEELKKILPEGYALISNESIRVTDNTSEVRVLVKSLTRKVPVKFMIDGRTVVSESELKVEIGKNTVITAEELKKILPEGYALISNESIRVTDNTSEVRVLVKSLTRKVPVKFMTDGKTVVSESELKVEIGKNTVITAEELKKIIPEGYVLISNESVTVTDKTSEVRVLVKKKAEEQVKPEESVKPEEIVKPEEQIKPESQTKPNDSHPSTDNDKKVENNNEVPKTGDNSDLILWISVLIVSAGALTVLYKNKKQIG